MRPWVAITLLSLIAVPAEAGASPAGARQPNIVVYISDDHSAADIGAYGATDVQTPVLDRFAADGLRFTRAYAAAPTCSPSRAALYTGLYPHRNGLHRNHGSSRDGLLSIAQYLQAEGYETVLAGKVHVDPEDVYPFRHIARHEIGDYLSTAGERPFALFIAYNMPHGPYVPKKGGYGTDQVNLKPGLPDVPEARRMQAAYYDLIDNLDHEVGAHQYWLSRYGLEEGTIQIFLTDQGWSFPNGKFSLYEEGIRGALMVRWPGVIEGGRVDDTLISYVDIAPTLIELAGSTPPDDLDGRSFAPLLRGERVAEHDAIFATHTNLGVKGARRYPIRAIRADHYKLIVNLAAPEPFYIRALERSDERPGYRTAEVVAAWKSLAQDDPDAASALTRLTHRPAFELYDIPADPHETNNLAGDPRYAAERADLLARLDAWMERQGDPELATLRKLAAEAP